MLEDEGHREWTVARDRVGMLRTGRFRCGSRAGLRVLGALPLGVALLAATWIAGCTDPEGRGNGPPPPARASDPTSDAHSASGLESELRSGPFLASRRGDPIGWKPWSADLFVRRPPQAQPEAETPADPDGKPVMVVLGYADCADCRTRLDAWAKEPGLASMVERLAVPVLVDRDERPDVDASLMRAVHLVSGTAGWPAVVFLDSGARPFAAWSWGAAGGEERPLRRILEEIERRSFGGSAFLLEKAMRIAERLDEKATLDTSGDIPDARAVMDAARAAALASFDPRHASFGEPPLFPRAPLLALLLHLDRGRGDAEATGMVHALLQRLVDGPMRDPSDGGFHRFAREPGWKVASPEKPLADNAVLSVVMMEAASWPGGEALGEASAGLVAHVERGVKALLAAAGTEASGGAARSRVFADTLGLAVSALAEASRHAGAADRPGLLGTAVAGAEFLETRLRRDALVLHCVRADGGACDDGYLDDQVFASLAFLDVDAALAAAGRPDAKGRWIGAARTVADAIPARFGHEGGGGFFFSGATADPSLRRYEPAFDGARPCGNSAAATLFTRLWEKTGEARYRELADATLRAYAELLDIHPLALPSMVVALDRRRTGGPGPPASDPRP